MGEVTFEQATPDDWALVRDIRLRALEDSPDSFGATLDQASTKPERAWREELGGPHPTIIATADGRGVAMGGVFALPDDERAWIWGMWIDPAFRGRGLGRRLLLDLTARAKGLGRTPCLHVTEGNDGARALYLDCGFVPTGVWEPLREGSDLRIEEMAFRPG